jgi:virginiamycin B lyase
VADSDWLGPSKQNPKMRPLFMKSKQVFSRYLRGGQIFCVAALLLGSSTCAAAQSGTYINISQYFVPTANNYPYGITAGPDGALWFTGDGTAAGYDKIGRITTAGVITEYPVPTVFSEPNYIAAGSDGALWFTETANQIGRITTAGAITEYPVPTTNSLPFGITAGPDGVCGSP